MSKGGENWKPYRPSNGSEGDCFQAAWCERCLRDKAARAGDYANGCDILLRALAFPITDALYPDEWRQPIGDEWAPECTAFIEDSDDERDPPPPDPDPAQLVLIADPSEDLAYFPEVLPELIEVGSHGQSHVRSFRVFPSTPYGSAE